MASRALPVVSLRAAAVRAPRARASAASLRARAPTRLAPRRARLTTAAALPPDAARAAVDAAVRGDAAALAAATGHAVNSAANVGVSDVFLFLLAVFAPPVALAVRYGTEASGAILLTSALMVLPTLALVTQGAPRARAEVAPVPLLCLLAADAIALARCFYFT
jgi:hypothetical protein